MKNVRIDGNELLYDCDGAGCATPGVPHRVPVNTVMAALEATFREYMAHHDPRLESIDLVMQSMYQTLFPTAPVTEDRPVGARIPWMPELRQLNQELSAHYSDSDDLVEEKGPTYVN